MSHVDFLSLTLDNAGCFKHVHMPLKDQGLVHIRGVNLDEGGSNGSGKSSLFEFLFYLWYDKLTKSERRIKKDELLNVYRPKDFLIHSEVVRDGTHYTAEKYRKLKGRGSGVDLWEDGTLITPDDPREAQKAITDIMGRSWNETLGSVYLSQKHTHKMIEGTPAEKRAYMSRYFGLDSLDSMISSTEKRLNAVPLPDETHLLSLLERIEVDLEELGDPADLSSAGTREEELRDVCQERLITAKTELAQQESAKETKKESTQWKKFLRSSFGLPLSLSEVKAALSECSTNVESLSDAYASALDRESILEELAGLGGTPDEDPTSKLESLSTSLHSLERLLPSLRKRDQLEDALADLWDEEDSEDRLSSRARVWGERLADYTAQLSVVTSELARLGKVEDSCYACFRPISSEEKREMLDSRESSLRGLRKKCKKAEAALENYSLRLDNLKQKSKLHYELKDLPEGDANETKVSISSLQKEYSRVKSLQSKFVRLGVLNSRLSDLPEVSESSALLHTQLKEAKKNQGLLGDAYHWLLQYGKITFDVHAYQRLTLAVASYGEQLKDANTRALEAHDRLTQYKSLRRQRKDIKKTLSSSSAEKTKSQVLNYITITLGELKKIGLRESTKLLSGVLPIYLNQLFPKGDIRLSETDSEEGFDLVFNKGGKTLPLTVISGGQAKRVGLAIVFSFAKMGRNTANLLICDEPFRDLDKNGREACFEVLRDFDIGTLLVTSHDQDLNASKKYDQVWTVQMKNNISTLYLDR